MTSTLKSRQPGEGLVTKIVIDTNVLVSSLLSPEGNPYKVLASVLNRQATVCYDSRIISEYQRALSHSKFPFEQRDVAELLSKICQFGIAVLPKPSSAILLDEGDKKFYEVAITAGAYLITGNIKHFPDDPLVITPAEYLSHHIFE